MVQPDECVLNNVPGPFEVLHDPHRVSYQRPLEFFESPLNDAKRQGGNRADLIGGLSYDFGAGDSLQVDVGVPIDEWVDGPQLSTTWFVGVALRLTW